MKSLLLFFLLITAFAKGQTSNLTNNDTLLLYDEYNDVTYKVNSADYLQEIKNVLPDSISRMIIEYITVMQDSIFLGTRKDSLIDCSYYMSMDFYEKSLALTFDRSLYRLFADEKLWLLKNGRTYNKKQVKTKVKRFYCCNNPFLYCGKDWQIFDKKMFLTELAKVQHQKCMRYEVVFKC